MRIMKTTPTTTATATWVLALLLVWGLVACAWGMEVVGTCALVLAGAGSTMT